MWPFLRPSGGRCALARTAVSRCSGNRITALERIQDKPNDRVGPPRRPWGDRHSLPPWPRCSPGRRFRFSGVILRPIDRTAPSSFNVSSYGSKCQRNPTNGPAPLPARRRPQRRARAGGDRPRFGSPGRKAGKNRGSLSRSKPIFPIVRLLPSFALPRPLFRRESGQPGVRLSGPFGAGSAARLKRKDAPTRLQRPSALS